MKEFFQGLVLGVSLMYGYVHYGADLLGPLRDWFGGASKSFRHDKMREEADKALHGFLFPRDTGAPAGEGKAHG
jgi:hypothetical protein